MLKRPVSSGAAATPWRWVTVLWEGEETERGLWNPPSVYVRLVEELCFSSALLNSFLPATDVRANCAHLAQA